MNVVAVAVDQSNNTPIVILRDPDKRFAIPIWIGLLEASAIQIALQQVAIPRPMTHDLLKTTIEQLDGRVVSVEVSDLRQDTFYAVINVERNGRALTLDARPSDAIALALRFRAPIFVDERVATAASRPELLERLKKSESEKTAAGATSPHASTDPEDAEARQIIEQLESGVEPKWKA
ncbi:MAG: bifunctional nuclease family protein [Deltaproteobacteria bacterium]|nr:bifunctional nuclease family protein [Deltaproteobacteria bacterium]